MLPTAVDRPACPAPTCDRPDAKQNRHDSPARILEIPEHRSKLQVSSDVPDSAAATYEKALTYVDCETLAQSDRDGTADQADERYEIDPSGSFAAQIEYKEQARRDACRGVGPAEYRQVDALMRDAAQRGSRDAKFYLLSQDVLTQSVGSAGANEGGNNVHSEGLTTALAEIEAMALNGHHDAMLMIASQLLVAGPLGPADPVGAATWNLAAFQLDVGRVLTEDDLQESGLLLSLTDEQARQALRNAAALLESCCDSPDA